jgi:tetratricopeptide (TPR) repeat protein
VVLLAAGALSATQAGCGWNPSRPFEREAPPVKQAIADLDAGDAGAAASKLEEYLSTGACKDGNIGAPDLVKKRPDGTFDLGLALFGLGERYGRRFGEEENDAGVDEATRGARHEQIECARRLVQAIADDPETSIDLRARARYLEGNLDFLDGAYEEAVNAYDHALQLAPGMADGGDEVGRDAAWNRAIALRRIEDKKHDAGSDASTPPDAGQDAPDEGGPDSGDAGRDAADEGGRGDAGNGGQDGGDAGQDGGPQPQQTPDSGPPPQEPDGGAPPPPATNEDERMLDQLENAPTLQQEEAKRLGKKRVRGMADK